MTLVLMLAISLVILLIVLLKYRFNYWQRRRIPHDTPSLIFGNLGFTHWSRPYKAAYEKFKGTGPFAGFYHYHIKAALLLEPELIKNVLIRDFANFDARGLYHNERDDPLTANIFFLDGPKWRRLRQKVTPAFTATKMRLMSAIMEKISQKFVHFLDRKFEENQTKSLDLNVLDAFGRYTADTIGSCAFGLDCNSFDNGSAEFVDMGRKVFNEPRHNALVDGLIMSFPHLARRLGMRILRNDVSDFYMNITRDTVTYREKSKEHRNDLMDSLIEFSKNTELNDDGLSFNEIAAQAFAFLAAGFETSSTTLSFVAYELAQNQTIQDKLRAHLVEILSRHDNKMNYECMQEMKYLDMVINETLRKNPPVAQLIRRTLKRYETSNPKYYIEPDTVVVVSVQGLHHDSEFYPEPEKFIPERFAPEAIQQRPQGTYLPFGDGPRNCIGYRFALMQIKFCLAYLLQSFRFSVSPQTQIPYKIVERNVLVAPENGIILRIEKV